jgi:hypothetical protein
LTDDGSLSGKKEGSTTKAVLSMPLLRQRGGILLGLPLRFPNLFALFSGKRLGLDL